MKSGNQMADGLGGKRPGAGRKPGAATKMNEHARKAALKGGISPLDYMLQVLRDENNDHSTRMDAAKAAAPFLHAKLSTIGMQSDVEIKHKREALPEATKRVIDEISEQVAPTLPGS